MIDHNFGGRQHLSAKTLRQAEAMLDRIDARPLMSVGKLFAVLADVRDEPTALPDRHFAGARAFA